MIEITETAEENISLPNGKTLVRWDFPKGFGKGTSASPGGSMNVSNVLLMVHGGTVPSWQFDAIVPEILGGDEALKDYGVLRLDLYGHGRSARPDVRYDLNLFVEQVLGVIDLCCGEKCENLVALGHSMGAAVLARAASRDTKKRFRRVVLVAPMLDYKYAHPHSHLLSLPFIGETLMKTAIVPKLKQRRRKRSIAIGRPELGQRFADEVELQHHDNDLTFSDAMLRMFRDGALGDQSGAYRELAEYLSRQRSLLHSDGSTKAADAVWPRVHVIWGSSDVVVTEKQIRHILHLLSGNTALNEGNCTNGVTYQKMKGMEHNLMLSHPRVSAGEIVRFLKRPLDKD